MSKEKQKTYDCEGIANVFRNAIFGMALIICIGYGLLKWVGHTTIEVYGIFGALILGIPYLLIVSNSKLYKKQQT